MSRTIVNDVASGIDSKNYSTWSLNSSPEFLTRMKNPKMSDTQNCISSLKSRIWFGVGSGLNKMAAIGECRARDSSETRLDIQSLSQMSENFVQDHITIINNPF